MAAAACVSDAILRMNCDIIAACTMHSGDPFSDDYTVGLEDTVRDDNHGSVIQEWHVWTGNRKYTVVVPTIDSLPHLEGWSSPSSNITSSTTASPTQEVCTPLLQWTNADLMYLLSCIMPDLLLTSRIIFSPPLENLGDHPGPFHIRLYERAPGVAPTAESFSRHAPIGTGRPQHKILLAQSNEKCKSPEQARFSLASNLLRNEAFATYMLDKYNVLTALYTNSTATLLSLQRGMIEMLGVSDGEWYQRLEQLGGQVDGTCVLEARMELFLLSSGRTETEGWVNTVGLAAETEERDRKVWAQVYGDAAAFLERVAKQMYWE